MSNRDNGGPAFPVHPKLIDRLGCMADESDAGISVRDYFAASFISSGHVFKSGKFPPVTMEDVAKQAYELSDAMLKERDK